MSKQETKKLIMILGAVALGFAIVGLIIGLIFKKPKVVDNRQFFLLRAGVDANKVETSVLLQVEDEKVTYAIFSDNFKTYGKERAIGFVDKEVIMEVINAIRDENIYYGEELSFEVSSSAEKRAEEFRKLVSDFRDSYFPDMKLKFNITANTTKFIEMVDNAIENEPLLAINEEEFKNIMTSRRNIVLDGDMEATLDHALGVKEVTIDCKDNNLKLMGTLHFYNDVEKLVIKNAKSVDLTGIEFDDGIEQEGGYTLIEIIGEAGSIKLPDIPKGNSKSVSKGLYKEVVGNTTRIFIVK